MRILFCGVLPPKTVNGVTISNKLNVEILRQKFTVDIIEEYWNIKYHNKFHFAKVFELLRLIKNIFLYRLKHKYKYFYLSLSLSYFGIIKNIFTVFAFKIFNKGKVIMHVHRGDFAFFISTWGHKFLFQILNFFVSKYIVLSGKQAIGISKFNQVAILHNTIEHEYNFGCKQKNKIISFVYISNYIEEKGILDLLEVFKSLIKTNSSVLLECYGDFTNDHIKQKIYSFVCNQILINGAILNKEKFEKIFNSDCLIFPSHNEGQPLVILEAMSIGTPVIATNVGDIPEMLGRDYPFVFQPSNKSDLKNKIEAFLQCTDIQKISKNLKDKYFASYSLESHKSRLFEIFV